MKKKYANVGGQAVIEGIMMKSPKKTVLAVRKPDGEIETEEIRSLSLRQKYKFFDLPIIRGCVAFVESLITGYKTISRSASLAGLEEETNGNKALEGLLMVISAILGVGIAVGLFIILPVLAVKGLSLLFDPGVFKTLIEGIVKVILFLIYLFLISRMKDIKRILSAELLCITARNIKPFFALKQAKNLPWKMSENSRGCIRGAEHLFCFLSF